MIHKALEFAARKHALQVRKGSDTPYIAHPAEVMYYLTISEADIDTIVGGILHDTLEDTDTTLEELTAEFGENIARLVHYETEDKTKPWLIRKEEAVRELFDAPFEVLLICCADKLSNLKSILADIIIGGDVWAKFTGTREQTKKYYSGIIEALAPLADYFIYNELVRLYGEVFSN